MTRPRIPSPPRGTKVNGAKLWRDVLGKYELEQAGSVWPLGWGRSDARNSCYRRNFGSGIQLLPSTTATGQTVGDQAHGLGVV